MWDSMVTDESMSADVLVSANLFLGLGCNVPIELDRIMPSCALSCLKLRWPVTGVIMLITWSCQSKSDIDVDSDKHFAEKFRHQRKFSEFPNSKLLAEKLHSKCFKTDEHVIDWIALNTSFLFQV